MMAQNCSTARMLLDRGVTRYHQGQRDIYPIDQVVQFTLSPIYFESVIMHACNDQGLLTVPSGNTMGGHC